MAFPIHRYPAEMARRHGARTAMFDRREQLVRSPVRKLGSI